MVERLAGRDAPAAWQCRVCGAGVPITTALQWRCPNATDTDRRHVLRLAEDHRPLRPQDAPNPFLAFRRYLAVGAFAAAAGVSAARFAEMISATDALVAAVGGDGFTVTPYARADELSDALGFRTEGGVWIKDETGNVAGSHKGRHLFTVALHLLVAEEAGLAPWNDPRARPPLAIASCGNAALAAATLAAALSWPIEVFVPPGAAGAVVERLDELGASVVRCGRRPDDPPGDPCVHRFRAAVGAGSIPFGVQGTDNAWGLDGGRTIGWEIVTDEQRAPDRRPLDRVFVQVGGGALADCLARGLTRGSARPKVHAVQTEGCAPLARAWDLAPAHGGPANAAAHWSELMWPWETEPHSLADGILDDETYDWLGIFEAMDVSGGGPVVAAEGNVVAAHALARRHTAIPVSPTGSAGLAGLIEVRPSIGDGERIAVVFSGVDR